MPDTHANPTALNAPPRTRTSPCKHNPCTIHRVTPSTLPSARAFIKVSRQRLFPTLSTEKDAFLSQPSEALLGTSCILIACAQDAEIVGAIAYTPFDHRFEQLPSPVGADTPASVRRECRTVEVVRLYVLPEYRRQGVAAALFWALYERAVAAGVRLMYLHSHPFLPGAIRFWEKLGFEIICIDDDETWLTHHMLLKLPKKLPPNTC